MQVTIVVYRLFVLEDDDSNEDHDSNKCQPQVDDEQAHVDWL